MKKKKPFQLQCWCHPTKNFEALYGCDYETREQGLGVFNTMLKDGRATGVRLVRLLGTRGGVGEHVELVAQGPLPRSYLEYASSLMEEPYSQEDM